MNAKEWFGHWHEVREGLLEALDRLTDGDLAFVPRQGLWSLGTVARHIANAEDGWFRYAVYREVNEWPPMDEAEYPTIPSLKRLLGNVHARTLEFLEPVMHFWA